jgi:pyruvate dehydrogenase E2 component (dihydrolipoamide acetyltransferase)
MPQLGETVTEGTIIKWLKKVGDPIVQDEPLFEVSTDKVDSEVPSPAAGFVTEILVEEGATVDVGTTIAVVSESADAPVSAPASAPPVPAPAAPAPTTGEPVVGSGASVAALLAGAAEAVAEEASVSPDAEVVTAVAGASAALGATAAAGATGGASAVLSPVVRKLLADNAVDASAVKGTGAGGRITRNDVLAAIDARAGARAVAAAPPGGGTATAAPSRAFPPATAGERDEVIPFTNIRRLTAEHMVRSKATSAHTLVAIEADYEGIERVRRTNKDRFKADEGFGLSYLPFIGRAVVEVLRDFPQLNASVGDNALLVHRDVHLGIAVDLDRQGLIVPVVRNADGQSLRGLARAISDLAERARTRHLSADDVVGGTFTISNPGPFGTFLTAPIINQPQVAILSTDGVKRRPVVVTADDGTEAIAIHSVGMLGLSFDHRAVDGAYASAFLYNLARVLETRDWSAEL